LCVWAYAAQRRIDEACTEFGDRIEIDYKMTSVFGVARDKLVTRWQDKGGLAGYAQHIRDVMKQFDHVEVHPDVWNSVAPRSSWPAHLVLTAIRELEAQGRMPTRAFTDVAWRFRQAFFRDARDVSREDVLFEIVANAGLDVADVKDLLASGAAHAELARDDQQARDLDIRVSPSIVMNDGRQRLNGNVGYRVLAASIRELLERPADLQSWC
jgi:predicted DsbA family dithiol-disulfide isomerase